MATSDKKAGCAIIRSGQCMKCRGLTSAQQSACNTKCNAFSESKLRFVSELYQSSSKESLKKNEICLFKILISKIIKTYAHKFSIQFRLFMFSSVQWFRYKNHQLLKKILIKFYVFRIFSELIKFDGSYNFQTFFFLKYELFFAN